jgi:branched-chain amino acid transport system substrate-binding protein
MMRTHHPRPVEQTRKLVEQDEVLLMFGSLGTATNTAVHRYLNGKKVPQLFVLSGATKWADPKNFPWTMPGMAAYESEASFTPNTFCKPNLTPGSPSCHKTTILAATMSPGFKRALGGKAASIIVAEASYETSAPTISSQLATLKASGANVLFGVVLGKFTSQMIKGVAELSWKPDLFFVPTSASSISFLEPAGLENAVGLISSSNQKDTIDAQWADDAGVKEYLAFMKQYLPNATLTIRATPRATTTRPSDEGAERRARTISAATTSCARRHRYARSAAAAAAGHHGIDRADDYLPFQQLRLRRFNGKSWVGFGDILDDRQD